MTLLALAVQGCTGWPPGAPDPPRGRLPEGVRPTHYALNLEIVPGRDHFAGSAAIRIELEGPQDRIWLHGEGLRVEAVRVESGDGAAPDARWVASRTPGVAAIRLSAPIGPGAATLHLRWRAPLEHRLDGAYAVEAGGADYVFTQLEPISARRVFPGFDEPRFKTPFDVTLRVPEGDVAIANTPEVSRQRDGERVAIRFATTPPLPTYLIAFAVGPFDVVESSLPPAGPRDRALPFRGVTVRGRGDEVRYALEHTGPLLESLEAYFGSPYPFAKLDVIAVPDFRAGAMENVGAVTFRDSLLLVDPETAPEWQRRAFANVMAHELAHMWFGNLVTMPWWDDIWLNEAFATWAASRTIASVHPEHHAELSQLAYVHGAMQADSLASARRIRQPIESDHDIANAFDAITYQKGAGVLSMFERWLGPRVFRDGVRLHMQRHAFANATYADLLDSLSEASGRDLRAPFQSFLDQPGVPFLDIEPVCDGGGSRLRITQERYRPVGAELAADAKTPRWQVPVCARYGIGRETREQCSLLSLPRQELPLDRADCPDWVMPNADGAGYYRYAVGSRGEAASADVSLNARERLASADSLAASFRAAKLPADVVLPALARLAGDPQRAVAEAPMDLLRHLLRYQVDGAERETARRFAAALYEPRLRALGWQSPPDEPGEARLLRGAVVEFLAREAEHAPTRAEATRRGIAVANGDTPDPYATPPETLGTVLAVAVQEQGSEVFDALTARLPELDDAVERGRILSALGSARDPASAARARALALDASIRVNEMYRPLQAQLAQPALRHDTWDWIESRRVGLLERSGPGFGGRMPWLATWFCDEQDAREVEEFFAPFIDELEGGPRNLAAAVESIRLCHALVQAQGEATQEFFRSNDPMEDRP